MFPIFKVKYAIKTPTMNAKAKAINIVWGLMFSVYSLNCSMRISPKTTMTMC